MNFSLVLVILVLQFKMLQLNEISEIKISFNTLFQLMFILLQVKTVFLLFILCIYYFLLFYFYFHFS